MSAVAQLQSAKDRNVLWLNNHMTACQFECDLLRGLGYNVFTPKYFPSKHRSFATTYAYDEGLPLSRQELELLNQHDFYSENWPMAVLAVINRHFGTAIVACFTELIYETVSGFTGRILLRSYGPFDETATVWRFLQDSLAPGIRRKLAQVGDRFWFSEAYPNLADPEHEFLKSRRVNHPTGISTLIQAQRNTYRRAVEKVLIVLPDIAAGDRQSAGAYPQVRRYFSAIPKVIAGKQGTPIDDPDVAGLIPWAEYEALLCGSAAMFYHNVNPRHLHYHPVEAACFGMPVIFMGRGMLGVLGSAQSPGACRTYEEAAIKLSRILAGDRSFTAAVIESQKPWVDYFMWDNNFAAWTREFSGKVVGNVPSPECKKSRRIALVMLAHPGVFFAEFADLMARAFRDGVDDNVNTPDIVIALPEHEFLEADVAAVEAMGWPCRRFCWQTRSYSEVAAALEFTGRKVALWSDQYVTPRDAQGSLQDCDAWIIVMDRQGLQMPIAPTKPLIPLLWRSMPEVVDRPLSEMISNARAVAMAGTLRKRGPTRLGLDPLNSFPVPARRTTARPQSGKEGRRLGPILIVLPKLAQPRDIDELQRKLDSKLTTASLVRDFVIVVTESLADFRDQASSGRLASEAVEAAIDAMVAENRAGRELSGALWPRIDAKWGYYKTRVALEKCAAVWFPLGAVLDLGLLAAVGAKGIPIISRPSTELQVIAASLGLDYRARDLLDLESLDDLLVAPSIEGHSTPVAIDVADLIKPQSCLLTWTDVVKGL